MTKIELERSYVFQHQSIPHIRQFIGCELEGIPLEISDHYIDRNLRVRHMKKQGPSQEVIELTRKSGNKQDGQRTEEQRNIDPETAAILSPNVKLHVKKTRYHIKTSRPGYIIVLDVIDEPMKLAVLEIESTNDKMPPSLGEIFGVELQECPLSAWDFFRQKIGICGAPSSGKTETAKTLSHLLNTRMHANSFHVLEYATSFIQKYDRHPDAMDQFMLWYSQRAREEDAASKANIVISDSPTFLSYVYMMFHNRNQMDVQFRIHLAKLYKRVLEDISGYSRIIYLRPKPPVDNRIRFHTIGEIHDIAERILAFLRGHSIPHLVAEYGEEQKILCDLFYMNEISKRGQA